MATTCYNNLINNKQSARRRKENIMKKDFTELLPEVTVLKTERYHIVCNKQGEYEVVNAFGAIVMNLGKKVK